MQDNGGTANGGQDTSATKTFQITVTGVNDAPTYTAGANVTVNEDSSAYSATWATAISAGPNESGQNVTFNLSNNNNTLFSVQPAISASGTLSFTPAANANGTATVSVTASDNGGTANGGNDTAATNNFTITVTAINDAPSFTRGADQTVNEDAGAQTVVGWATNISAGPADEAGQTLTFNATNDNNALFTVGGQPAVNENNGNLTYTLAPNAFGVATVSVTLSDNGGGSNTSAAQTFTITVNAINDAPVLTAGNTLAYTENQAASVINSAITVSDIDDTNLESATVQITGNFVTGQDVLSFTNQNGITGSFAASSGTLTLTGSATLANYQTALRAVRYNNTSENPSTLARTVTWIANDGGPVSATNAPVTSTINVTSVNDAPTAVAAGTYNVQANIQRSFDAVSGTGLLVDSTDPEGTTLTMDTTPQNVTTGATVTLNSDGSFVVNPPPGFTGNMSFQYRVQDSGTPAPNQFSAPTTVTIAVSGPVVWFADDSAAAGGNGTLARPFQTLAQANTEANTTGERIFLYSGNYTGGVTLSSGVLLYGQAVTGGSFDTALGINPPVGSLARPTIAGAAPVITTTAAATNAITVSAGNNTIAGLNIGNTTGSAIASGASFGTLTVTDANIGPSNRTGQALSLTSGALNATFGSVSANSAPNGISLSSINGNLTMNGGSMSSLSGSDFNINGGNANITYPGTITNTAGQSINISNKNGGTVAFSGAITDNGSGISLSSNGGTTFNFTGGLTLNTGANAAFSATGGGTVSVTGAANTLNTTTGIALNVVNTNIGASRLNFRSISSSGGSNAGIILDNTGTNGLVVTGQNSDAGSGGTIANKMGSNGSTTTGVGAYFNNTGNISLSNMAFSGTIANYAIRGNSVSGFTLRESTFSGSLGDSGGDDENAIRFTNLSGTAILEGNNISGGYEDNVAIVNTVGSLDLTVRDTAGGDQAIFGHNHISGGNDSLFVSTDNDANLTLKVEGVEFTGWRGDGIQASALGTSNQSVTINNNSFVNSHGAVASIGGSAVTVGGTANSASSWSVNYSITNNISKGARGSAITAGFFGSAGVVRGLISGNTIGTPNGAVDSLQANTGSNDGGHGILAGIEKTVGSAGRLEHYLSIKNNTIRDIISGFPIYVRSTNGGSAGNEAIVEATITGNTVDEVGIQNTAAVRLGAGGNSPDTGRLGLDIQNNIFNADTGGSGYGAVYFDMIYNTQSYFYLPGYGGSLSGESYGGTASNSLVTYLEGRGNTLIGAPGGFATNGKVFAEDSKLQSSNLTQPAPLLFASGGVEASATVRRNHPVAQSHTESNVPGFFITLGNITKSAVSGLASWLPQPSATVPQTINTQTQSKSVVASRKPVANPVTVAAPVTKTVTQPGLLTQSELDIVIAEALQRWEASGLTRAQSTLMHSVKFEITDLPGWYLGEASGNLIRVDSNAGGNGWFIDATPFSDNEFSESKAATRFYTDAQGTPAGHIDLLTAIMHELGHAAGLSDSYLQQDRNSVMYGYLTRGERRLPREGEAAGATPGIAPGVHRLSAPVTIGTLPPGKSITFTYSAKVNDPLPDGTDKVSNQGTITADGGINVKTDDPDDATSNSDITVTPIVVNTPATATNLTQTKTYTEGAASVALDDIVVTDPDSPETITATLTLANTATGTLSANNGATYNADTGVWSKSDTVAEVNTALAAVVFQPATNNDVNTSISTVIRDASNEGPAAGTISLNVTAVNDAPTATQLTQTRAYTEGDASVALNDIVVTDPDTSDTITATLTLANTATGTLSANDGATYTSGTGVWTISGTLAQVNTALANVAFIPATNNDLNTSITTLIRDAANTGPTAGSIALNVSAVNDAPVATDDALSAVAEDSGGRTIAFTALLGNDTTGPANESSQALTITSVSNPVGGTATIQGIEVIFTPAANFHGAASFDYVVQDNGTTGGAADPQTDTGSVSFNITPVADTPAVTNASTSVNTQSTSGLVLTRHAADGAEVTHFKITGITNGTLFQNDGTTAITNGSFITVAQGNAGLKFTPATDKANPTTTFSFDVQASISSADAGLGGGIVTATITVSDPTPPDTTITLTPPTYSNSTSATFEFTGSDNVTPAASLTFEVKLDSGIFVATNSPLNLTGLSQGSHTLQVRALDASGNADPSPASYSWTVDTTKPTVTISGPSPTEVTYGQSATYTITYADTNFNQSTLAVADITLNQTGTANGTVGVSGSGTTRTVTISNVSGDGTLGISLAAGTASDLAGNTTNAAGPSATFVIDSTNDAPTGSDDVLASIGEDSGDRTITFSSLLGNDSAGPVNESGQTLTITSVSNPVGGTVQIVGTDVIFTPALNFNGTASFDYLVQDNGTSGGAADFKTDVAAVSFPVSAVNDKPLASDGSKTTDEDTAVSIDLSSLVSDVETAKTNLTYNIVSAPAAGEGILSGSGSSRTFTPAANFNGQSTFTYQVRDTGDPAGTPANERDSDIKTITVTVTAVNDTPELDAITNPVAMAEDSSLQTVNLSGISAGPADEAGQNLTVTASSSNTALIPAPTVTYSSPDGSGTLSYTPVPNAHGSATITVTVTDNGGTANGAVDSRVRTFVVTVSEVNDAPTGVDDTLSNIDEDSGPRTIPFATLLNNDVKGPANENTQSLTILSLSNVTGGTATIQGSDVVFSPTLNYNGPAGFDYVLQDNGTTNGVADSKTSSARASFAIIAVNNAPVNSVPGTQSTSEDTALVFSTTQNNAISVADVDAGNNLVQMSLSVTNGTLTLGSTSGLSFSVGDGSDDAGMTFTGTITAINQALQGLTFKPNANVNGTATLTIVTNDLGHTGPGAAQSDTDTVAITITSVNDAPLASDDNYVASNGSLTVTTAGVLQNDSDVDGDALSAVVMTPPAHGTLTLNANGSFVYTAEVGFNGEDFFTYRASDGKAHSNVAKVTIAVSNNPTRTLSLSLPQSTLSEGATQTATILLSRPASSDVVVSLSSSDTSAATVPATVVVAAGSTAATFVVQGVDDALVDGSPAVVISAGSAEYGATQASLTISDDDVPTLKLTVAPATFNENAGPVAALATLTRNVVPAQRLTVKLNSTDTGEVRVPQEVIIPSGARSTTFWVEAIDDRVADGAQNASIVAKADRFVSGVARVRIEDNGRVTQALTLTLQNTSGVFGEGTPGDQRGSVSLPTALNRDAIITLSSSDTTLVGMPRAVLLRAGQKSAGFVFRILDNTQAQGTQRVYLMAKLSGVVSAVKEVRVLDNDEPMLTLTLSKSSVSEGSGSLMATLVARNTPTGSGILVKLSNSDPARVSTPTEVWIPAGRSVASFPISVIDNNVADGDKNVTLTVSRAGLRSGTATLQVLDNDSAANSNAGPSSSVKLSTATAQAASSSLRLRFTAALDAADATEAARWSLLVNSQVVEVESLAYDAGTYSVVLTLAEGSLRSGDPIKVLWTNLRDKQGRLMNGQTTVKAQ
jgi:hypothetical protein